MSVVDLELFKAHVNADDFANDDTYLAHLLQVAEAYVLKAINRECWEEVEEMGGGAVPADLKHAILLIGGHLYDRREPVASGAHVEIPYTMQALLKPYRRLV